MKDSTYSFNNSVSTSSSGNQTEELSLLNPIPITEGSEIEPNGSLMGEGRSRLEFDLQHPGSQAVEIPSSVGLNADKLVVERRRNYKILRYILYSNYYYEI